MIYMEPGAFSRNMFDSGANGSPERSIDGVNGKRVRVLSSADAATLYLLLDDVEVAGLTVGMRCRIDWLKLKQTARTARLGSLGAELFLLMEQINHAGVIANTEFQTRWHIARNRIAGV